MATYFDETHIQQILQAVDIAEVVARYVALKPKGKELVGLCPFHNDKRPSLNVSPGKQIFKCFSCGAGGDVIKFLMLREKLSFPEAVKVLADKAGIKLPSRKSKDAAGKIDRNKLEAANKWAAQYFQSNYKDKVIGRQARDYVQQRGINPETAQRFGLGWAPAGWDNLARAARDAGRDMAELVQLGLLVEKEGGFYDRFRERLIFPVYDALSRVIGFGGRTLADDPAKYLNSPESELFNKSRAIYGLHVAKDAIVSQKKAIVVEGYTDCLMAQQYGLENVAATLGTALTNEHARMLSRYTDQIVLVYDSDEAGQKAADRAIDIFFANQVEVRLVTLPQGEDPCDFIRSRGSGEFTQLVENATDALEYLWRITTSRLTKEDTITGRKRAAEEFLTRIGRACVSGNIDEISRGFLINKVAKLVGIAAEDVHKRLNLLQRRMVPRQDRQAQRKDGIQLLTGRARTQKEILEVLLNRPDLFPLVQAVIEDAGEFTDPILNPIAQRLWSYCSRGGMGPLSEILAGCESTEMCNIMTDMADKAQTRGNFEQTLEGALEKLRHLQRQQSLKELREQVSTVGQKYGSQAQAAVLLEYHARKLPAKGQKTG